MEICQNPNSRVLQLLGSSDIPVFVCPIQQLNEGTMLFNPYQEHQDLLRQWLLFRRVPFTKQASQYQLAILAADDMLSNGNIPPFTHFYDFDVTTASVDFLRMWLSWFGVTASKEEERIWWDRLARQIQTLQREVFKKQKIWQGSQLWTRWIHISNQHYMLNSLLDNLEECLTLLTPHEFTTEVLGDIILKPQILKVEEYETSRVKLARSLLAWLFGGAAIALPLVYWKHTNQINFEGGISAFASRTWDELKKKVEHFEPTSAMILGLSGISLGLAAYYSGAVSTRMIKKVSSAGIADLLEQNKIPQHIINSITKEKLRSPIVKTLLQSWLLPAVQIAMSK